MIDIKFKGSCIEVVKDGSSREIDISGLKGCDTFIDWYYDADLEEYTRNEIRQIKEELKSRNLLAKNKNISKKDIESVGIGYVEGDNYEKYIEVKSDALDYPFFKHAYFKIHHKFSWEKQRDYIVDVLDDCGYSFDEETLAMIKGVIDNI